MRIVADANLALLDGTFARHGEIRRLPGRQIGPGDVRDADVLLLRSVTRADRHLLEDSAVRFVGTATIGADHVDIHWLEERGITWAAAPGCNADAAAQYTLAMIMLACERLGKNLRDLTAGIIGRGNVGSRLERLLNALGVDSVANDPPLAEKGVSGLATKDEALSRDIVCLHVPLTRDGPWPTWRMIGAEELGLLPEGALLVNSARGDVIDGDALLNRLGARRLHAGLDVWPAEPDIDPDLLAAVTTASPHVAGYSIEGKRNGTLAIYAAFCQWAGLDDDISHVRHAPRHTLECTMKDSVEDIVFHVTHVRQDDRSLRELGALDPQNRRHAFDGLRKNYALRSDFAAWRVTGVSGSVAAALGALGFRVDI